MIHSLRVIKSWLALHGVNARRKRTARVKEIQIRKLEERWHVGLTRGGRGTGLGGGGRPRRRRRRCAGRRMICRGGRRWWICRVSTYLASLLQHLVYGVHICRTGQYFTSVQLYSLFFHFLNCFHLFWFPSLSWAISFIANSLLPLPYFHSRLYRVNMTVKIFIAKRLTTLNYCWMYMRAMERTSLLFTCIGFFLNFMQIW